MNRLHPIIGGLKNSLILFVVLLLVVSCGPAAALPTPSSPQATAIATDLAAQPGSAQDPTVTPVPATPTAIVPSQPTSVEWQDQTVYVLSPHKFYDGDPSNNYMRDEYDLPNPDYEGGFLGGDIAGIRQKIPYLKSLGITAVLINPVFCNDEKPFFKYLPTGYSIRDYQCIDRNFGTIEEFAQMVEEFHSTANGPRINVILDLPMSILGNEHPWKKDSRYFRPWNDRNPQDNLGCTADSCEPFVMDGAALDHLFGFIPILNPAAGMDNETGVYREIRDNIVFWLVDQYEVDGFVYVSAHNFDAAFWVKLMSDFNSRYGAMKPDFLHIADVFIWPGTEKSWQVPSGEFINQSSSVGPIRMDGVYDHATIAHIQQVFATGADPNCTPGFCANLLQYLVPQNGNSVPLLVSVDGFNSFLKAVENGNGQEKLYLASTFLLTINRVPVIYSGNEYGIDYGKPGELFSLGLQDYHENYKKLLQIRQDHAAFRRGSLIPLDTTTNILSYARQYEGETFIVVLNNAAASQPFTIDLGSRGISCSSVTNLLAENDQTIRLDHPGKSSVSLTVTLDPWEPKIIQCE